MTSTAASPSSAVTLLTVAPTTVRGIQRRAPQSLAEFLSADYEPGKHVMACARRLTEAGIRGQLKLRQGKSEHEIAGEVAQGHDDLVTIAAEAHGDFVQRVLNQLGGLRQPVLVIKPIAD